MLSYTSLTFISINKWENTDSYCILLNVLLFFNGLLSEFVAQLVRALPPGLCCTERDRFEPYPPPDTQYRLLLICLLVLRIGHCQRRQAK